MNMCSKIGLGTAAVGRPQYINIRQEATSEFTLETYRQKGIALLEEAYHYGIRYFDTAPGYGMAEQLLIEWSQDRKDVEIASKWGYSYIANYDPQATVHEVKEHSLAKLKEQWQQSRKLLPILSTYQIHSATLETNVLKNAAVLNYLAALKEVHGLRIGLTTTGANQVEVLQKAMEIEVDGQEVFDVFQVTYNIFDQSLSTLTSLFNNEEKRLVIKEALANGRIFPNEKFPHYAKAYKLLTDLAAEYEVGIDAIALRFCIDSIPAFKILSGAAKSSHLTDNLKAEEIVLSNTHMESLKSLAINPLQYWKERKQLAWN